MARPTSSPEAGPGGSLDEGARALLDLLVDLAVEQLLAEGEREPDPLERTREDEP